MANTVPDTDQSSTIEDRIARTREIHAELAALWGVELRSVSACIHRVPGDLFDRVDPVASETGKTESGTYCSKTVSLAPTSVVGRVDLFCAHDRSLNKADHAAIAAARSAQAAS